jgi:hypothetical protein
LDEIVSEISKEINKQVEREDSPPIDPSAMGTTSTESRPLLENEFAHPLFFRHFPSPPFRQTTFSNLAERYVWFPDGLPNKIAVCIASSRIGNSLEEFDRWFDALRTLASRLDPRQNFFVTASPTTTNRYLKHVARRFGFDVLELYEWSASVERDFHRQKATRADPAETGAKNSASKISRSLEAAIYRGYYQVKNRNQEPAKKTGSPEQPPSPQSAMGIDQLLLQISPEVFLLSVRPGGNILAAAMERLEKAFEEIDSRYRTWLLIAPELTPARVQEKLMSAGATGWWLYETDSSPLPASNLEMVHLGKPEKSKCDAEKVRPGSASFTKQDFPPSKPILALPEFRADDFLIHWTRARVGPWPNQTEEEYLDDLLFRSDRRLHGEKFALSRILVTKRIFASHRLTRDGHPVVCFSNRRLSELPDLKSFRSHLRRWDFVPFGIAVERQWIEEHGGRPVIYGDEATWQGLPETERPLFQLSRSRSGKIDWTIEQEWRWMGDLRLDQMPLNSVAVFVPTLEDAQAMLELSNWPIVILN